MNTINIIRFFFVLLLLAGLLVYAQARGQGEAGNSSADSQKVSQNSQRVEIGDAELASGNYEVATIGGGCFWCVEAVYEPIVGVVRVVSGYAGGTVADPSYDLVVSGSTGHAEVIQIHFDPETISYKQVLQVFFKAHDPTTLNRQGYDVGTQYRSIILYHSEEQRAIAEEVLAEEQAEWNSPIVTQLEAFTAFYKAEGYHQDFYENNPNYGYCVAIIRPKLEKLGLLGVDEIEVLDLKL